MWSLSVCSKVAGQHLVKLLGETHELEKQTMEHAGASVGCGTRVFACCLAFWGQNKLRSPES